MGVDSKIEDSGAPSVPDDPDEQGAVDLRTVVSRLWLHRWWVGLSLVVCTVILTGIAFLVPPVYRVDAVLIPANPDRTLGEVSNTLGELGGLTSIAGFSLGSNDARTQEALAVLKSRELTQTFIEEEGLMPKLFARDWDVQHNGWKSGLRSVPTFGKAYRYFDRKIRTVSQDRKSGLVTVSIYWKDRTEAANWANELVRRLNAEMRARAIAQANESVADLERELTVTTVVETRQAISRLIAAQVKQRMMANVTPEYVFRVVDKAIPPDVDDPAWPNKPLLLALGPIIGIVLGIFLVLLWDRHAATGRVHDTLTN